MPDLELIDRGATIKSALLALSDSEKRALGAALHALLWADTADQSVNRIPILDAAGLLTTFATVIAAPVADRLYGTDEVSNTTALRTYLYVLGRIYAEKLVRTIAAPAGNLGAIALDGSIGLVKFNLTGNAVFNAAITGLKPGVPVMARFVQDATGSRTITSSTATVAEWTTGTDFVLRSSPNLDTYAALIPLENGNVKVRTLGYPSAA